MVIVGAVMIILGIVAAFVAYNAVFIAFALASKIKTFLAFAAALRTVGIAQGLLNIVMMANPIGLVAAAVGLLVAGLVLLFDNWDAIVQAFKNGFKFIEGDAIIIFILSPGAFIVLGYLIALINRMTKKTA